MTGPRVMIGILAVAILVGGFSAGRLIGQLVTDARTPTTRPMPVASDPPLPGADVAGRDIATLPRYPGSVRAYHARDVGEGTRRTVVAYVVAEPRTLVRSFYTDVFRDQGWEIVDLGFAAGTWRFVVERPARHATLEIHDDGSLTHVRIEMVVRDEPPARETPRPRPEETARPATPPPDDDDDGDDSDDDGGTDDD